METCAFYGRQQDGCGRGESYLGHHHNSPKIQARDLPFLGRSDRQGSFTPVNGFHFINSKPFQLHLHTGTEVGLSAVPSCFAHFRMAFDTDAEGLLHHGSHIPGTRAGPVHPRG